MRLPLSCPWLYAHRRPDGAAATPTNSPDAAATAKRQLRLTAKLAAIVGELINQVEGGREAAHDLGCIAG
jgi:hypothetical protein